MANSKNYKLQVYQILKEKILSNEFGPNQYLEEKKLCEMMGVSRTPIREAINLLTQENLVQVIPNKGIFVTDISIQSVRELFDARGMIEPLVLQRALPNLDFDKILEFKQRTLDALEQSDYTALHWMDYEFHNYINSCCRNSYMIQIMRNISDQFQRVRTQDFYSKERTENGAHEHLQLIELIIKGEREQAVELLRKHINSTQEYYFRSLL